MTAAKAVTAKFFHTRARIITIAAFATAILTGCVEQEKFDVQTTELSSTKAEIAKLQIALKAEKENTRQATAQATVTAGKAKQAITAAETKQAKAQQDLDAARKELAKVRAESSLALAAAGKNAEGRIAAAQADSATTAVNLAKAQKALTDAQANARKAQEDALAAESKAMICQAQVDKLTAQVADLNKKIADLEKQLVDARAVDTRPTGGTITE